MQAIGRRGGGLTGFRYRFDDKALTILNIKPRSTAYRA